MKRMSTRLRRGFSMIEMMVSSGVSLAVIAGALAVGAQLQRRAMFEEETTQTQNASISARDMLVGDLQRAGGLAGTVPITLGSDPANYSQVLQRYSIAVTENATSDDFNSDVPFETPPKNYTAMISDAIEIWTSSASQAVLLEGCTTGGPVLNASNELCSSQTIADPNPATTNVNELEGQHLLVVDSANRVACVVRVKQVSGKKMTVNFGLNGLPAPSGPCIDHTAPIWSAANSMAAVLTSRAYRVNWKSGGPMLEYDPDGSGGPADYMPLSGEIERIKVRLGVAQLSTAAGVSIEIAPANWFPNKDTQEPSIADCANPQMDCGRLVPGGYTESILDPSPMDAMMRRVRGVQLTIASRSSRADKETLEEKTEEQRAGEVEDPLNPKDGYKRRTFSMTLTPRNFLVENPAVEVP